MYIMVGNREKIIEDIWAGHHNCPTCGGIRNLYLKRVNTEITAFFIPILTFSTKWAIVCEGCDHYKQLKRKEYLALRKEQIQKLEQGLFPAELVKRDYEPKKLKLGWKLAGFLGSLALGACFCMTLFMIPAGLALMYFGYRNYSLAMKKKKAYEQAMHP